MLPVSSQPTNEMLLEAIPQNLSASKILRYTVIQRKGAFSITSTCEIKDHTREMFAMYKEILISL